MRKTQWGIATRIESELIVIPIPVPMYAPLSSLMFRCFGNDPVKGGYKEKALLANSRDEPVIGNSIILK